MKSPQARSLVGIVLAVLLCASGAIAASIATQPSRLEISVDPRVELMSVIFYLAGSPEYSRPLVKSYADDVNAHFAAFKDHEVIKLARELRRTSGISYDAPMSLAVHLTDANELKGIIPLNPRPEGLDPRWKPDQLEAFLAAARAFSAESKFTAFIADHQALYTLSSQRMTEALSKHAKIEWFEPFFGQRRNDKDSASQRTRFHLLLGLLNGGQCYGPHLRTSDREELYCILGVWNTDKRGEPIFPKQVLPFVVHEFCHSYANPLIDAHRSDLQSAGQKLFDQNQQVMRKQAYATPQIMLRESLVRACVVRYRNAVEGKSAAEEEIAQQQKLGFAWMRGLSDLLGDYEAHRDQYQSLDDFMPRIVKFFDEYAK